MRWDAWGSLGERRRVAWEKRTPLALSTLRRALSGKQRPETAEVLHALQVLEKRVRRSGADGILGPAGLEVHRQQATADGELRPKAPPLGGSHPWDATAASTA